MKQWKKWQPESAREREGERARASLHWLIAGLLHSRDYLWLPKSGEHLTECQLAVKEAVCKIVAVRSLHFVGFCWKAEIPMRSALGRPINRQKAPTEAKPKANCQLIREKCECGDAQRTRPTKGSCTSYTGLAGRLPDWLAQHLKQQQQSIGGISHQSSISSPSQG